MLTAIISIGLIVFSVFIVVNFLPMLATALLYGLVAIALLIQFVAKKFLIAVPWTIAAVVAVTVGLFALGLQFFGEDDAKRFVEKFLPPRDFERKTLSLALIELMIVLHGKIAGRLPIRNV